MPLPLMLQFHGRTALVVGGGSVALRKARALLAAGARVRLVAPQIEPELLALADTSGGYRLGAYDAPDLEGVLLVVAATNDEDANAQIVADAAARGILACDASRPERGDFTMPATARCGDLTFAVETGGSAPAFGARIAHEMELHFGREYARAAQTLRGMRVYVQAALGRGERGEVLRELANLPVAQLAAMNPVEAEHCTEAIIARLRAAGNGVATSSVVCASRASALALTQTRGVAAKLARLGVATTILTVATTGDRVQDRSFQKIGSVSLFVKELETALRDGRAHYAVHSCKDLPSMLPTDMAIAAISAREDPRDVYCSERYESFAALPAGSRVGTSSLRRRAQLAALRSDLTYADLRGNVDTRLRKLREGEYDAIVLAAAGLQRLAVRATYTVAFEVSEIVPAAGQGALAAETLASSTQLAGQLRRALNDRSAELAVFCERAALARLQGGCQAPIGIHARFEADELVAEGAIAHADGSSLLRRRCSAPVQTLEEARALGERLAQTLLAAGANEILAASPRSAALPLAGKLVLLPRTRERASRIAAALRSDGAEVVEFRAGAPAPAAQRPFDLIVFPSSAAVKAAEFFLREIKSAQTHPAVAAMGPLSAAAAQAAGFPPNLVSPEARTDALIEAIRKYLREPAT